MNFVGRSGTKLLFSSNEMAAVVDEKTNSVVSVDYLAVVASSNSWSLSDIEPTSQSVELANAALTDLDISVFSSSERMHTIPKAVQEEAKRALEWRKEFKRGGTPVGLNTARTLAKGGQIGIKKIRHIAKYFPRHEVDKKGKGYKPGEPGYPSRGRIAWALWGGDAAQRWASAIVERENKKENSSLIASHGYYDFETPQTVDLSGFNSDGMKYMVRVRMDGTGIDRLYAVKPCGTVLVWDDGSWDDLGHISHDIDTYDKSLDDPYDSVEKMHVPVDVESAITVAALFDADPFRVRSLDEVSPEDHSVYMAAIDEMDFSTVDAIVAATGFKTNQDGDYTSEERSQKATAQLRDALGRFAQTGSRVIIGKNPNYKGEIISQDEASQTVKVKLDDGKYIDIAANQTQQEDTWTPVEQGRQPVGGSNLFDSNPIDTSGILGEPRTPVGFSAQMPGTLPPLTRESLSALLNDFPAWVSSQRLSRDTALEVPAPPMPSSSAPDLWYDMPDFNWPKQKNAMNNPYIRKFLEDPKNRGWYTFDLFNPDRVEAQKSVKEVYAKPKGEKLPKGTVKRTVYMGGQGRVFSSLTAAGEEENKEYTNPRQSDIEPIYMAIVAEDDVQAVMDLIALVPKGPETASPMTFKREPGKWVPDESILKDLNSPTPPPVIMLDNSALEDVVKQIDGPAIEAQRQIEAMEQKKQSVAASAYSGGPNEEALKRYWISGRGSSKIRWGSSGDFDRCVEHLSKEMGPRARGYCALLLKEATGEWVTERTSPIAASGFSTSTGSENFPSQQEVLDFISMRTQRRAAKSRITAGGVAYDFKGHDHDSEGSEFYIPLVIPEDSESGDGRIFEKGSITMRELPLPLLWQIKTGEGHNGSVVVGKILKMERTDDGIGNAYGVFDSGVYGAEAERLVRGGFIRGVSADLDKFEADEEAPDTGADEEEGKISNGRIKIKKARIMAVTLVPKPAFQECQIVVKDQMQAQEETVVPDGIYVDDVDAVEASALVACGIVAGVIPTTPPASWFENPALKEPTPLTVDDDGRVFGHIAAWHVDHIGMSFGTKPPRSRSKYAYFHTGVVRTEEGSDVPVGQLTLAGGHASLEMSAQEAVRHYDDTASAIADVHAGEDAYGIWVAGALRPGTTPEQIRSLRASAPSGDWRPIKGHLELVAVCQVNVPGFPIARARVASGAVMALVAAGATTLARMKSDPVADLRARIAEIEQKQNAPLVAAADAARAKVLAVKAEELAAKVGKTKKDIEDESDYMLHGVEDADPGSEMAVISRRVRERLAQEGKALPDGSFPIRNVSDLKNAVRAYGRAKVGSRARVRRHIVKRARGLGRTDLVPQEWKEASVDEIPAEGLTAAANDPCWEGYVMVGMKTVDGKEVPNCVPEDAAYAEYATAEGTDLTEFKYFSPEQRKKLAEEGKALPDGSFPIESERDLKNAIWAFGRAKPEKKKEVKAHIIKRAEALGKSDMIPDIWEGEGSTFSEEDADPFVASLRERTAIARSMVAAGGLDRNRGNAERLRRYWTRGPGALKIRWGTPGDWKRCVRYLSKYMGVRAKGYCQLRHKEVTGVYTGSRLNPGRRGRNNSIFSSFTEAEFGIFESLYGDPQKYLTEVSDIDMMIPLDRIMEEKDPLYDVLWQPEQDIIVLIKKCGYSPSGSYVVDGEDDDSEYDMDDMDASVDGYEDDGLLAAAEKPTSDDWVDDPLWNDEFDDQRFERAEDYEPDYEEPSFDEDITQEDIDAENDRYKGLKLKRKGKYTADTQPRDTAGRFRKVLARLKVDLGTVGADRALEKIEEVENLDFAGDYGNAAKAAGDLISIIDRLDTGGLNPESITNVRESSRELGRVIANLPFAFGEQAEKVRFSDLPPALRDLIEDMITRVEAKIGKEDANVATQGLKTFMSGGDFYSQSDISSEMAKMLRLLT